MSRWSIGRKLGSAFAVIILISALVGVFSAVIMARDAQTGSEISKEYLPEMQLASKFEREVLNARIFFIYHVLI